MMNSATITYTTQKDCFVAWKDRRREQKELQVYEITNNAGDKFYVSCRSGETTQGKGEGSDSLLINQLYANKLGLQDRQVVITRTVPSVATCQRVNVEPVSVDDWEILERHANTLETGLLNQVRVVWSGQTLPVWVGGATCIFITVASTEPSTVPVLLVEDTEVIVAPKVRKPATSIPPVEETIKPVLSPVVSAPFVGSIPDLGSSLEPPFEPQFNKFSLPSYDETDSSYRKKKSREKLAEQPSISNHWRHLMNYISESLWTKSQTMSSSDEDEGDSVDVMEDTNFLAAGMNMILRVQKLSYTPGLSTSRQDMIRSSPQRKPTPFIEENVPQQPSTVYVDVDDLENQFNLGRANIPKTFFAKLRRLPSPKEQQHESHTSVPSKMKDEKESPESPRESPRSPEAASATSNSKAVEDCCVVRVVVLDRRRQLSENRFQPVVKRVLMEQELLGGHVILPDLVRRLLKLEVGCRAWLQTMKGGVVQASSFSIYLLGNVPKNATPDKMTQAFKVWLETVSSEEFPLVVFEGLFIRFPFTPESFVEAQITFATSPQKTPNTTHGCFTLLHPGVLRGVPVNVVSGSRASEMAHPAIKPMLPYTSTASFDPILEKIDTSLIGGMENIFRSALSHLEICFATRPLYRNIFQTSPGLMNGMLLLTGAKGSGKSSIARVLCRQVAELPNLAHAVVVDCKPLRGKKVDNIQKSFEMLFDEAAWRQPSLIVFDDLDHVAGAPAGPEFEMSGEALYAGRIAEVLKDLLRKDIRNMSRVAVLATSKSRSSLHPILVASRGTHLVQEVVNIPTPDKTQRREILNRIMETRFNISDSTFSSLNWEHIVHKTEGFVARDLANIVNRAVHAHVFALRAVGSIPEGELDLTQHDFELALTGFTPASIRNVSLHQAGELGWEDIGGLTEVKKVLTETLQWPTKYPLLFSSCPLRLRSGLLLYGAPGTGKTLLAGVVAKECGLNFISIKGPELLSKYIGASEQAMRDTFTRAQSARPCILFFDEFDAIAPRRGHDNTGVTDRVVNQLLTQLDGVEGLDGVYVLAATSRPDLIDPALLRPGRLDKCLLCPLPNQDERLKILEALSRKMLMADDVELRYFAENCEDFTGADFKALLYNAQLEAIHELTGSDDPQQRKKLRYGSNGQGDLRRKNKTGENKRLLSKTMMRERSWGPGKYAYIPNLETGVQEVSTEMEERLSVQVSQIRLRERRNSEHIPAEEVDSPLSGQKLLRVTQRHLVTAFSKMRPSVSGEERMKYVKIYENFMSAREGNFNIGYAERGALKATLA